MPNLLKRFNQSVVGSNQKLADYLSKIDATGDFKRIRGVEVIVASWSNILVTPRRTYQFDPSYGSNLYKLVFDPADNDTKEKIVNETVNVLRQYDDRAVIKNVRVNFLSSGKGFDVAVDVEYEGETGQIEVVIDENTYFKFLEIPISES